MPLKRKILKSWIQFCHRINEERTENKRKDFDWRDADFRHYILLVKIFSEGKIELQNLEIFTTCLKRLLELRRIHSMVFKQVAFKSLQDNVSNN
jgi:hypothetical protein